MEWTGVEPGCKVECGGWSTQQGNEYLGAKPRLLLTPQTNRYYVFISAALREKSAVLFKCCGSHPHAADVFEEFSSVCTVAHKTFACSEELNMRTLMQYLNGAALASVWIFFEHMDALPYVSLQAFNKEVQMVQQQFIIAELSGQDVQAAGANRSLLSKGSSAVVQRDMRIEEQSNAGPKEQPDRGDQASKMTSMKEDETLRSVPSSLRPAHK